MVFVLIFIGVLICLIFTAGLCKAAAEGDRLNALVEKDQKDDT